MDSSEPIKNRYLWGATSIAEPIPIGTTVSDRYRVVAPNIWVDSSPQILPEVKPPFPDEVFPYLRLYPYRLHLPEVYAVGELPNGTRVLWLDNAPLNSQGNLMPSIIEAWAIASSVRKVDWLWQILELWEPLASLQVASSLLVSENLRVDGWRVRLLQLDLQNPNPGALGMQKLATAWQSWFGSIDSPINGELAQIYQLMQLEDISIAEVKQQVNQLLMLEAQSNFFQVTVAGATDVGVERQQNEDSCYPLEPDLETDPSLATKLAIVCDGVGGHDAGEVASSLAVYAIKWQLQAMLNQLASETTFIPPEIVAELLAAQVRVANNLIWAGNEEQKRDSRQKMATTLVMALQLPQAPGEVYIAHVGDSRAYWLSAQGIVLLTIDDNLATELVAEGKSAIAKAQKYPNAAALTQALGVEPGELVQPRIRRFMVSEEGILLLCSDGLSDNDLLELHGKEYLKEVLSAQRTVKEVLPDIIAFANEYNGHDNISAVLMHFQPSSPPQDAAAPSPVVAQQPPEHIAPPPKESKLAAPRSEPSSSRTLVVTFVISGLAIAGAVTLALAMLSDRLGKPQIERSPVIENQN